MGWRSAASLGVILAVVMFTACGRTVTDEETRHRFTAMGTFVDVTIWGAPASEADAATREVEAMFHTLHHEWHPWGEGKLGQLNEALAAGEPAAPGPDLAMLFAEAAAVTRASNGLFNPAIGALVRLWGFASDEQLPDAPPPPEEIAAQLEGLPRFDEMLGADGRVSGPPGTQIDLNAFLKGVAVDRAVALLRARNIEHAIVNAGGDLRAIGRRGDRPWRIGIRAPRDAVVLAALEIEHDDAVFTSGDYERFFEHQGRRYHHILDPRTGYPTAGLASVSVVHRDAGLADAAATALMVAGPEGWPEMAATLGIEMVMVVHADGAIELTEAMRPRIRFPEEEHARRARVRPLP
jgi:FAD:protein FMN transferase